MRVLVTGASGFVGSSVVPVLTREGHEIVSVSRHGSQTSSSIIVRDLSQLTMENLTGIDAIVNLAGKAHSRGSDDKEYDRVNHYGVTKLAQLAEAADVSVFIQLSTAKVYGNAPIGLIALDTPTHAQGPYAESKAAADRSLSVLSKQSGMRVICIRPPLIYGPNPKGNIQNVMRFLSAGLPMPKFVPEPRRSFLSVLSLSRAIDSILGADSHQSGIFPLADRAPITPSEFLNLLAKTYGYRLRLVSLPIPSSGMPLPNLVKSRLTPLAADFWIDPSDFEMTYGFSSTTTEAGFTELGQLLTDDGQRDTSAD